MQLLFRLPAEYLLYLRDPEDTELGRRIVGEGILLMEKLGYEQFTFKKLAAKLKSTEASVYRYFSSKGQFLDYCNAWYWTWLTYRLELRTRNLLDPKRELEVAIDVLGEASKPDLDVPHIDEPVLHRLVVSEGKRSAGVEDTRRDVSVRDKPLLRFRNRLAEIINRLNPKYPYPRALAMTLILSVHGQLAYSLETHDISEATAAKNPLSELTSFLLSMSQAAVFYSNGTGKNVRKNSKR